jgi:hypothetical protein
MPVADRCGPVAPNAPIAGWLVVAPNAPAVPTPNIEPVLGCWVAAGVPKRLDVCVEGAPEDIWPDAPDVLRIC